MTTKQILDLDCTVEQNMEVLQKALRKIGPLSKYEFEEVPQWAIEKVVHNMCHKYELWVREIAQDPWSNAKMDIWRVTLVEDGKSNSWDGIKIFGASIYETLAKTAIQIYSMIKAGKAGIRK